MATQTAVDVVMPQMGVSVSEGTITKWLKQPGDAVEADESLLEISTDKVDTEVPSPASGVLQKILAQEGETVDVGTVIAVIGPEGSEAAPAAAPEAPARARDAGGSRGRGSGGRGAARGSRHRARAPLPLRPPRRLPQSPPRRPSRTAAATRHSSRPWSRASPPSTTSTSRSGSRHRTRRPRDEEGHPRIHRVRRSRGAPRRPKLRPPSLQRRRAPAAAAPAPAEGARSSARGRAAARARPSRRCRRCGAASPSTCAARSTRPRTSRRAIEVDMSRIVAIREKLKKEYQKPTASTRRTCRSSPAPPSTRSRTTRG